jgi:hypothetical protein
MNVGMDTGILVATGTKTLAAGTGAQNLDLTFESNFTPDPSGLYGVWIDGNIAGGSGGTEYITTQAFTVDLQNTDGTNYGTVGSITMVAGTSKPAVIQGLASFPSRGVCRAVITALVEMTGKKVKVALYRIR